MFSALCRPWICPLKTWLTMRFSFVLMAALIVAATTPPHPVRWWPDAWLVNGVVAWLLFHPPFCAVFFGVSRPNCYVPRQHVPSIIQAIVLAVPDLYFVLCVLTGDGDPEGSNPRDIRVQARGGGLWRISDVHCAYDPLHFVLFHPHGEPGWHPNFTKHCSLKKLPI
jgi:hypothetical protein